MQDQEPIWQLRGVIATCLTKVLPTLIIGTSVLMANIPSAMASSSNTSATRQVTAAKLTEINVPDTTPMAAAALDLASQGYTEREFLRGRDG